MINEENNAIPGLYAAGNAAGGLFYGDYIGGSQFGAAVVFARIAKVHKGVHEEISGRDRGYGKVARKSDKAVRLVKEYMDEYTCAQIS